MGVRCQIDAPADDRVDVERIKHLIERFAEARERGDRGDMRRCWNAMVTEDWDRLRGYVRQNIGGCLHSPEEADMALSEASVRLTRSAIWNFQGASVGEWRAFLRTLAGTAALDVQRGRSRTGSREVDYGTAQDDPASSGGISKLERASLDAHEVQESLKASAEYVREFNAFLSWALPQLPAKQRTVWEMWFDEKSYAKICEELDMTLNTAQQNKSRAQQRLNELKESYES